MGRSARLWRTFSANVLISSNGNAAVDFEFCLAYASQASKRISYSYQRICMTEDETSDEGRRKGASACLQIQCRGEREFTIDGLDNCNSSTHMCTCLPKMPLELAKKTLFVNVVIPRSTIKNAARMVTDMAGLTLSQPSVGSRFYMVNLTLKDDTLKVLTTSIGLASGPMAFVRPCSAIICNCRHFQS